MPKLIQIVVYAGGAVAVLVVINWARHELVVGIVAACLVAVAATLLARAERVADDEER